MLSLRILLAIGMVTLALVCGADEYPTYVGAAGGMLLPGNGSSLRRAAEVDAFAGFYTSDFLAWEAHVSCVPNASSGAGGAALTGVSAGGLFHLSGVEAFDKLFGCERFDPFVTFGGAAQFASCHVFAEGSHRTALGPTAGVGAFYHLSENLDLRCDARTMLGIDSPCGMLYSVTVGLQWNFGGGGE